MWVSPAVAHYLHLVLFPLIQLTWGGVKILAHMSVPIQQDVSDTSSVSGIDSPLPEPMVTTDLVSLRVSSHKWEWEQSSLSATKLLSFV